MRNGGLRWRLCVASVVLLAGLTCQLRAAEPFNLISWLTGPSVDQKSQACGQCGGFHEGPCINRIPVDDCAVGKKELFDCKIKFEYVSVPETRYHWKNRKITKEIPCPYCKPICVQEECQQCVGHEKWEKYCDKCGETHCRHIEHELENVPTARCEHVKGETTIKVKYKSCVKVPYTVYRQVKRPICVKQPYYEKVHVPVVRYVCEHCRGGGCAHCGAK